MGLTAEVEKALVKTCNLLASRTAGPLSGGGVARGPVAQW